MITIKTMKLKYNPEIILIIALLSSAPAYAIDEVVEIKERKAPIITCDKVNIEYPDILGKTIQTTTSTICHDPHFTVAYSENCKQDKCSLITKAKEQTAPLTYSVQGTPGSWLCHNVNGDSMTIFMTSKSSPHTKIHICEKDNEIVSLSYLLEKKGNSKVK